MWEPGNRSALVLLTALSLCFFLYKAWGPLLLITTALVLVCTCCYSLLVEDALFSPWALRLLDTWVHEYGLELLLTLRYLLRTAAQRCRDTVETIRNYFGDSLLQDAEHQRRLRLYTDMNSNGNSSAHRRGQQMYRLSSDFSEQPSPIVRAAPYHMFPQLNGGQAGPSGVARTSTPLHNTWRGKDTIQPNGTIDLFASGGPSKKISPIGENRQPSMTRNDDTMYSAKGSPWVSHGSPKLQRPVQTIAGPLLNSSRYNIDPKIYTDVSSPGLTSRLTKYAAEASGKLNHQTQYTVGQFPKVNLYANPAPLLSPRLARSRAPVTVRIAPPDTIPYALADIPTVSEQRANSSGGSPLAKQTNKNSQNVVQVLREISLKRHASRDDIFDLAKKQRTGDRLSDQELSNLEEMMQKRAREDTLTSDEECSPKAQRPVKRSKASSCHDILNSLSSSSSVASGVKRKTMDTSRCNTPDIEKHFKSSSKSPIKIISSEIIREAPKLPVINVPRESQHQIKLSKVQKTTSVSQTSPEKPLKSSSPKKVNKEVQAVPEPPKLTDKLFMKAESHSGERLKTLIENQAEIEAKFAMDDKEEIKKEDIINMRQNSMRLRLQNMFDAISGKTANKIDPDVVIQAEEVTTPLSSPATSSLTSTTTVTSINTSPISTSSIVVPILKSDSQPETPKNPTPKHVTFDLPKQTVTTTPTSTSVTPKVAQEDPKPKTDMPASSSIATSSTSSATSDTSSVTSGTSSATTGTSIATSVTSTAPAFKFGSSTPTAPDQTDKFPTTEPQKLSFGLPKPIVVATTTQSSSGFSFGASNPVVSSASFLSNATFAPKVVETSAGANTMTTTQTTSSAITFGNSLKQPSFAFGNPTTTTPLAPSTFSASAPSINFSSSSSALSTVSNLPTTPATATTTPATTTSSGGLFAFGAGANSKPSFSFGSSSTTSPVTTATNPVSVASTSSAPMLFGMATSNFTSATTTSGTSMFTTTSNAFAIPATTFGTQSPSMNFAAPAASPSIFKPIAAAPTTTAPASSPSFSFGGNQQLQQQQQQQQQQQSQTPVIFGTTTPTTAPATTTAGLFSNSVTQKSPSIFTAGLSIAPGTTVASNSIFGTGPNAVSIFSGTGSPGKTTAPPTLPTYSESTANSSGSGVFGQSKMMPSSIFGSPSSAFGATTNGTAKSTGSIFSSPGTNATQSSTSGGLPSFSNLKPAGATNSTVAPAASIFGTANSFGASGSTNSAPGASVFGAANAASASAPIFGSTFGAPSTGATTPAPAFGAAAQATVPAFGSATSPAPSFGGTTNAFGGSNQAAPPAFGAAVASNSSNAAASPFGMQQAATFGNAQPSGGAFSFGGAGASSQQQQQTQQQMTPSFSFGGTTNNAQPAPSGGIFQFGAGSNQMKPVGFNFSAPTGSPTINFSTGTNPGAPPTFNAPGAFAAPTAASFSIGSSGSSQSRARASRTRRQR